MTRKPKKPTTKSVLTGSGPNQPTLIKSLDEFVKTFGAMSGSLNNANKAFEEIGKSITLPLTRSVFSVCSSSAENLINIRPLNVKQQQFELYDPVVNAAIKKNMPIFHIRSLEEGLMPAKDSVIAIIGTGSFGPS